MLLKQRTIMMCALLLGLECFATPLCAAKQGGLALQFSLQPQPVTVSVSGIVTDKNTGAPIAHAWVGGHIVVWMYRGPDLFDQCPCQETRTDEHGQYVLEFVTPLTTRGPMKGEDTLCVYASAHGYETTPQYARPEVTSDNKTFLDFDFKLPPGKRVTGQIVDRDGLPVVDAIIRVQNGHNGDWNFFGSLGKTMTDTQGNFELWIGSPQGNDEAGESIGRDPWLFVHKPGVGAGFFWDILKQDDMGKLMLSSDGSLTGSVMDVQGHPIKDCEIYVHSPMWDHIDQGLTDKDGRYTLTGIPGEPSMTAFYMRKNNKHNPNWGQVEVFARMDPSLSLKDVPQYKIMVKDGQTVTGPDLVVGSEAGVSGRLLAAKTALALGGLMVRLDGQWSHMVEADINGHFHLPYVSPGQHTLTVYLPHNLRYDRGIGRTTINVTQGTPVTDVSIPLDELAELRIRYLDMDGNPLAGITAGATWSKNGNGSWTEGTVSDAQGWAVLYLYPNSRQYIRGYDKPRALITEIVKEVNPNPAQTLEPLDIVMVPVATLQGRVLHPDNQVLSQRSIRIKLNYAEGLQEEQYTQLKPNGVFILSRIKPGVVDLVLETEPLVFSAGPTEPLVLEPGAHLDLGDLRWTEVALYEVTGHLRPSSTFTDLEGFKIRLDLEEWEPMLSTNAEGHFVIPKVPNGKHRLTAYLPHNRRTNRGVGHVNIDVRDGHVNNVELQLETLATVHVRITDEAGHPLEGIAAAAWWTQDHSGVFTEGTQSDAQGRAILYLYPESLQYVGAHDWDDNYTLTEHHEMNLAPGQVVEDLHVVMRVTTDQ